MKTRSVLAVFAAAVFVAALATLPADAAPNAAVTTGRAVQYAKVQRACAASPRPGHKACFAMRLVPVAKQTPGATAMTPLTPDVNTGPSGFGYTPAALATAYGYNPAATLATPQTVAIIDAFDDPNVVDDLNAFDTQYGLQPETLGTSFQVVDQNGDPSPLPTSDQGWSLEISLDVQAVRGACNNCKILLVEANSSSSGDLATAVNTAAQMGATEISNSYGGPERANESPSIKNAYNHPRVVITASSGDDGWFSWDKANDGGRSANKTNTPAAYPTVVAVTGTKLVLNSNGTRNSETVWNENGLDNRVGGFSQSGPEAKGASGGGCSTIYTAPTWQAAVPNYKTMGCKTGKRVAGDVAAVGDPQTGFDIFDSFETGPNPSFPHWIPIGGTSLSSPLVAAMWALAGGAGSEKYPAKSLYDRRRYTPTSIKDITVGGNSWCDGDSKTHCSSFLKNHIGGGNGNPNNLTINGHRAGIVDCGYNFDGSTGTLAHDKQCYATTGYDGASGVGAPRNLTAFMPTRITVSLSGPSPVVVHTVHSYSATNFTDGIAGATAVSYKWTWGDGTSTTKTTASASHKWGHTGAFKVTLVVTDSKGQKGSTSITVHVTT